MRWRRRRRLAWLAVTLGALLVIASAGPLTWGFGCVLGAAAILGGGVVLTDSPYRPANERRRDA